MVIFEEHPTLGVLRGGEWVNNAIFVDKQRQQQQDHLLVAVVVIVLFVVAVVLIVIFVG